MMVPIYGKVKIICWPSVQWKVKGLHDMFKLICISRHSVVSDFYNKYYLLKIKSEENYRHRNNMLCLLLKFNFNSFDTVFINSL